MNKESNTYIFGTGKDGAERLNFQNELISEKSYKHLKDAGLTSGKIVFDIGCGNGVMTSYLAKAVGPTGHVYAVDISNDQIEVAKEHVKSEGVQNVTFIHGDISIPGTLPQNLADIVYMRFVLMHMREPNLAIKNIKALLKEDGVVASMEAILKLSQDSSESKIIKNYYRVVLSLGKHNRVDYNIGEKLKKLYEDEGYSKVISNYQNTNLSYENGKKFLILSINQWQDKAIESGVVSKAEALELINGIENLPENHEDFFYPTSAFVLAYK